VSTCLREKSRRATTQDSFYRRAQNSTPPNARCQTPVGEDSQGILSVGFATFSRIQTPHCVLLALIHVGIEATSAFSSRCPCEELKNHTRAENTRILRQLLHPIRYVSTPSFERLILASVAGENAPTALDACLVMSQTRATASRVKVPENIRILSSFHADRWGRGKGLNLE
jgi:hypothetical protein